MAKMLIIDDSPIIRNLLVDLLVEEGHEVKSIGDPVAGTKMAIEEDWDICICDSHMPSKPGWEVIKEVNAVKPQLRFLIIDSMPEDNSVAATRFSPDHCYLRKPFDLEQIREILVRMLIPIKAK